MADVTKIKLPDNSVVNIKDNRIPGIDEVPTENSENIITSGGVYDAIVEVEEVTAAALNDLKDRIDNIPEGGDEEDSDFEEVTAAALNDLNDRVLDLESSKELPPYSSSNNGQFLGVLYRKIKARIGSGLAVTEYMLRKNGFPENIIEEDSKAMFIAEEGTILLKDKDGSIKSIGEEILAVCRYLHPETGTMCYTQLGLDELFVENDHDAV